MAKVKGPLLSMDARGKIANSIVFGGWKGIQTVRQYVIPANPETQKQIDARALMTAAVGKWRDPSLLVADKQAWDAYAPTLAARMSGFNAFCKTWIDVSNAGKTPLLLVEFSLDDSEGEKISVEVKTTTGKQVTCYWGSKPSRLDNSNVMADNAGTYSYTIENLTPLTTIYVACVVTSAGFAGSRTGILSATVAEA